MLFFLIDSVIQEEGLYVHKMHNIVEKHLSINIASVRSRGGSLVLKNMCDWNHLSMKVWSTLILV
jgi:hypothetical protein